MATKKTSRLDFSFDNVPQGDEYLLMDHRMPEPESSDAGKPVIATGADTYGLGKRTVIHVCTATANSSANAMMLDIAKSEVMDGDCLLVTFASLLGVRLMFNGGVIGNPMYSILYQGSSFPDDGRCLNAGDTWMVRFSNNTFNLLFRDREHFEDAMLGDGAFYPNAVQDYDGNWYHAVILGNQVWLTENLRTTHYSDGTAIEYGGGNSSDSTPYYYHPRGNAANDKEYGLLYNFAAVMNGASVSETNPSGVQGIAPTGWHVPSSAEWNQLKNYMERQPKFRSDGKTSSYIAKALASVGLWGSSSVDYSIGKNPGKNNRSGFNSKPAGGMYLPASNNVSYDGENSSFFSSTSIYVTGSQTIWSLHHINATFDNFGRRLPFSHSVRCVCDMTPYQFREWYVRTYGTMQHQLSDPKVMYGECTTAPATQTKTATVDGFAMREGETFILLLRYGWSSNSYMMFDINGLGAKIAYGMFYYYSSDYPIGSNSRLLVTYHTDGGGYYSYVNLSAADTYLTHLLNRLSDIDRQIAIERRNLRVAPANGTTTVTIGMGTGDINVNASGQNERIIIDNRDNTSDVTLTPTGSHASMFRMLSSNVKGGEIAIFELLYSNVTHYVCRVDVDIQDYDDVPM